MHIVWESELSNKIVKELRDTMTMCGTPTLADIGRDNIFIAK